jgi:putative ABC transport system permease protein
MTRLAYRNLFHDKTRLAVTLTGIAFAIVLMLIQLGLFIGFTVTTSSIIDHSRADLWICAKGVQYFEVGFPLPERKLFQILSTPGVAVADKYIVKFTTWRRPDGAQKSVEVIGFDPGSGLGAPWNLVAGSLDDLKPQDTVVVDEFYAPELGISSLGDLVEINGYRARVVGFTRGIRSFTTTPFVFTSFKNALNYTSSRENEPTFILVRAESGTDLEELKARISARVATIDVVGQTIYATTLDHLRDFGILKAIGASDSYVYGVIIQQAVISASIGYVMGIGVSLALLRLSRTAGAMIIAPWELVLSMFFLALLMCISASLISIHKVTRLDPAMVFKS